MAKSKAFNKFLRDAYASGTFVGDINQATTAFQTGQYPTQAKPGDDPTPPPPIKFDQTPRKLVDDGENLKIKKKSKRNRKAQAKGTGQLRISNNTGVTSAAAGGAQAGGTGGLNLSR
jgi:hypothetical protein